MRFIATIHGIVLMLILRLATSIMAQPTGAIYANTQHNGVSGLGGKSVTNPDSAINIITNSNNVKPNLKSAVLQADYLNSAWLHLTFPSVVTAGSAPAQQVTVYLKTSENAMGLFGQSATVEAFNNTSGTGNEISVVSQKSYYLADGTVLLAVTMNANFQSVRITLAGPFLSSASIRVYHAFYGPGAWNTSNPYPTAITDCGLPNVTSKRFDSGLLSLMSIDNPGRAIDSDPINSKSSFNVLLAIGLLTPGAKLRQMFYFNGPSNKGDAVRIVASQSAGLLSATLLGKITIQAYNGSALAGDSLSASALIEADLLDLFGSSPVALYFAPKNSSGSVIFDRVEISLEVAGLSLNVGSVPLNIHDVRRVPDMPTATLPSPSVCTNIATLALSAFSLDQDALLTTNLQYNWYNVIRGGSSLKNDKAYSPTGLNTPGTFKYYVDTGKTGCGITSRRQLVTVTVKPTPSTPSLSMSP